MLEELPRIPLITGPKFVFAHIDCPHPPFVFDEAGNEIERNWPFSFADGDHYVGARGTLSQYREGYVGQVKFISKQITEIIDTILARSSEPPVILLQADHGPGSRLHWESLADTDLNERFSIFNSYYLPGSDSSGLYPSISPVNSFRLILNKYFGTNFEMIADRQIFTTWTRPYNFVDVSERFGIPETVE